MKRRWFQIHLSTAIAVMFVASALIGLNAVPRRWAYIHGSGREPTIYLDYGWPDFFYRMRESGSFVYLNGEGVDSQRLVATAVVALVIVSATGFGCEYLIRRREDKLREIC